MITLLIWGMRNFLIQPSYNAEHLWTSHTSLITLDRRLVLELLSLPPLGSVGRICICLYVDADTTQSLAEAAVAQPIPTIILEGKPRHATTNMEAVTRLLEPPDLDRLTISERRSKLRKNRRNAVRVVRNIGPFIHGQSISQIGAETKGSVAVFLSPEDEAENRAYALTAYDVVPFISTKEARVITLGGLDVLTRLRMLDKLGAKNNTPGSSVASKRARGVRRR
jgi:hypothetical protein